MIESLIAFLLFFFGGIVTGIFLGIISGAQLFTPEMSPYAIHGTLVGFFFGFIVAAIVKER